MEKIVELYSIVNGGNTSLLKLNSILENYGYEVKEMTLQHVDRFFREIYDLKPLTEAEQALIDESIADEREPNKNIGGVTLTPIKGVSEDLVHRILDFHTRDSSEVLNRGSIIVVAKITPMIVTQTPPSVFGSLGAMQTFCRKLEKCLRLVKGGYISLSGFFAYDTNRNKAVIKFRGGSNYSVHNDRFELADEDLNSIKVIFEKDLNLPEYLELAVDSFLESYNARTMRLRFIQLIFALEACFNKSSQDPITHIIARHGAILLSKKKKEFEDIYKELKRLYGIRSDIVHSKPFKKPNDKKTFEHDLPSSANKLEDMTRKILAELIALNISSKESLFDILNCKGVPVNVTESEANSISPS